MGVEIGWGDGRELGTGGGEGKAGHGGDARSSDRERHRGTERSGEKSGWKAGAASGGRIAPAQSSSGVEMGLDAVHIVSCSGLRDRSCGVTGYATWVRGLLPSVLAA